MHNATEVTVEVSPREDPAAVPVAEQPASDHPPQQSSNHEPEDSTVAKKKKTKSIQPTTPLPLRQLVPMTFVLLSESLCSTLLTPFVGYLVAYLQDRDVDEAGYFAGILVGVFAVGQVVSARFWGRTSDQYGRRLPLIIGLFTASIAMLGFGLSRSFLLCAICRFLQGACNGNVLVAKTMMADITDKTNQAQGFAFVSFVTALGYLLGPLFGGLLYDPAAEGSAMKFLHLDPEGTFGRCPALLPSLLVVVYNMIGVVICTAFVQESNPNAKPIPHYLKLALPCMLAPSKPFVKTPMADPVEVTDNDASDSETEDLRDSNSTTKPNEKRSLDGKDDASPSFSDKDGHPLRQASATFSVGVLGLSSPVALEDSRRFDQLMEESCVRRTGSRAASLSRSASRLSTATPASAAESSLEASASLNSLAHQVATSFSPEHPLGTNATQTPAAQPKTVTLQQREEGVPETETAVDVAAGPAAAQPESTNPAKHVAPAQTADKEGEEEVLASFGYREAFVRPITRFMLVTYMILVASDLTVKQCFPLWAVASKSAGGLALTPNQISYILLCDSFPTLVSNLLFAAACARYQNKIGLFRLGLIFGGISAACISLNAYWPVRVLQFIFVILCTSGQQFFVTWCYGLNNMLTARSAPPGHVGSLMGIAQSVGGVSKALVPLVASPVFAWSISGNHIFPFNHVLVFFLSSLSFTYCWYRSYSVRTTADGAVALVTTAERYGPAWLRGVCGCKGEEESGDVTVTASTSH